MTDAESKIAAWVAAALPMLTAVELHRAQRAGHAVPVEPYATLYTVADRTPARPGRTMGASSDMVHTERRIVRIAVDLYGEEYDALASALEVASYSIECLRATAPHTVSQREIVRHPTAQRRSTVFLTVHTVEVSTFAHPTIDEVEIDSDI